MPKPELPPLSDDHREFNRRVAEVEDRLAKHVVPLYGNRWGKRYVVPSGVLLQIDDTPLLITAAHVLDEQRHAQTNIELPGRQALIPIAGQAISSQIPAGRTRDDDSVDMGILFQGGCDGIDDQMSLFDGAFLARCVQVFQCSIVRFVQMNQ
jgi:hypothetical protein